MLYGQYANIDETQEVATQQRCNGMYVAVEEPHSLRHSGNTLVQNMLMHSAKVAHF